MVIHDLDLGNFGDPPWLDQRLITKATNLWAAQLTQRGRWEDFLRCGLQKVQEVYDDLYILKMINI